MTLAMKGLFFFVLTAAILQAQCSHNHGRIRLVGGSSFLEGRVEVDVGGSWGTVCDDYWDTADATVVCAQLGYGTENATARSSAYFGQGSGPIHLDNVTCNGSESRLIDCSHISIHNCGHHKDAGVTCSVSVGFEAVRINVTEKRGDSTVEICATLRWPWPHSAYFYLIVNTHPGSAGNSDFQPLQNVALGPFYRFAPRQCFNLVIIDDDDIESNESFTIDLSLYHDPHFASAVPIHIQPRTILVKITDTDEFQSCSSFLRRFFPERFLHCSCSYSEYGEWTGVLDSVTSIDESICKSREVFTRIRTRQGSGGENCLPQNELQQFCWKTFEERIIDKFQLGSAPLSIAELSLASNRIKRSTSTCRQSESDLCPDYNEYPAPAPNSYCDGSGTTTKFRPANCKKHAILFALDTSGSIGEAAFGELITQLSHLAFHFCTPVQVAMMTFSDSLKLEFCFDCYEYVDVNDRRDIAEAISKIRHDRGGFTHTGPAVRCIHHDLLDQSLQCPCGLDNNTDCLDVVIITDGQSNGDLSGAQLCKEANCLRNHPVYGNKIRVYAMGIDDAVNQNELNCIAENDLESIFNTPNAADFIEKLKAVLPMLSIDDCVNTDQVLTVI